MKKLLLFLVAFSVITCGCGKVEKKRSQNLRICFMSEPSCADPQKVCNSSDYKVIQAAFEGLIVPDPETMKPLPGVAERWTISPDGKTYDFFLRDNAVWSDGGPVTADNFVYAVKRALSSKVVCPFSELFFPLQNAKLFFDRKIRDFSKVGVTALNPRTLRITLEKNTPEFLTILMHPCWSPLKEAVVKSFYQYNKDLNSTGAFKVQIISNGPFVFSEKIPGECLLLKKNNIYWDADNVLLSSVTFFSEKNQVSAKKKFSERAVDIAEIYNDGESALGDCSSNNELVLSPAFGCFALAFNTENKTFQDKNVRLALCIAINREKLLNKIEKNNSLAAYNMIPPCSGKYKNDELFKQDVALAKELLAAAGYNKNNPFPLVKILCNTSESGFDATALKQVQKDWENELGVQSQIESKDLNSFFTSRKKLNFDVTKMLYGGIYCDPSLITTIFTSKSPKNYGKWSNAAYDKMVDEINQTFNRSERRELIRAAEKYLAEEMPIIPLFYESNSYLVRKRICGWFPNTMNIHPLKFVYFSE